MGVCVGRRLSIAICVACVALLQVPALADQALRPPTNTPAPEAPTNSRTKEVLTDAAIIAALIAASIAAYRAGGPGPCACPEHTDRAGHRCGRRSAHDKARWLGCCLLSKRHHQGGDRRLSEKSGQIIMPSGYEGSPDYRGKPPLDRHRVVALIVYIALVGGIGWLLW